ncbi:MAG: single-stranded-DNA-specific exonuclease RecJ [Clostridia bacterium]|nr:single-stranded-DNA-specific exonuclease RecJ [Clostridia bacterium]
MEFARTDARPAADAVVESIRSRFGFTKPFAAMLARRGLVDDASITAYLHPEAQRLPDPFALRDMDRAVARIRKAIDAGECICVYGDYDTDGVCATAILTDALRRLGADATFLLPSRQGDGYGLSNRAVDAMRADGVQLIVTVDNGISAHAEIAYAGSLGVDTVVTDHHRCHETLPDADAIVCASREDQPDSLNCLCGASVAMLLAAALGAEIGRYLPVAALATMADVVPLGAVNRTIVRKGLPLVAGQPALAALLEAAGVREVTGESTLSFILAPRINAAGRMGDATRAVRMLLTEDDAERREIATELESENVRRRAEEQRILHEAEAQITETEPHILVLRGENWNTGVIGIVASRLAERYHCPAMLFSEVNGVLIGSGRSVPAIDLFALLTRHKTLFTRFGGHRLAAGATLLPARFDALREALDRDIGEQYPEGVPVEPIRYEDTLALSDLTFAFAKELTMLSPFGEENRMPLFRVEGTLSGMRVIGRDGMHLGARLSDAGTEIRLVAFGMGERYAQWSALTRAQALVSVELGSYLGRPELSIRAEALRAPIEDDAQAAVSACIRAIRFKTALPDERTLSALPKISETEIRETYRRLLPRLQQGVAPDCLDARECAAVLPLLEIGVLRFENGMFFTQTVQEKKQIRKALLYPVLCLE